MLIVTGVRSSQIVGLSTGSTPKERKQAELEGELEIEFVE
jgi:hypothetical protein